MKGANWVFAGWVIIAVMACAVMVSMVRVVGVLMLMRWYYCQIDGA